MTKTQEVKVLFNQMVKEDEVLFNQMVRNDQDLDQQSFEMVVTYSMTQWPQSLVPVLVKAHQSVSHKSQKIEIEKTKGDKQPEDLVLRPPSSTKDKTTFTAQF